MYGLQIRNGDEVSEISEYIGSLSGFDGQNFNPVVTTEPLSGYGLAVDNQKLVLHNDDTYVLRQVAESDGKHWHQLFRMSLPEGSLLLGHILGDYLLIYALDRVTTNDKKGQFGLISDSRIFAPIQKPASIDAIKLTLKTVVNPIHSQTSKYKYQVERYFIFHKNFDNNVFLNFSDLKRNVFRKNLDTAVFFESKPHWLKVTYMENLDTIPDVDATITIYRGIR